MITAKTTAITPNAAMIIARTGTKIDKVSSCPGFNSIKLGEDVLGKESVFAVGEPVAGRFVAALPHGEVHSVLTVLSQAMSSHSFDSSRILRKI